MKTFANSLALTGLCLIFNACTYIYYPTYPVVPDAEGQGGGVQGTVGLTRAQVSGWYAMDSNLYVVANVAGSQSTYDDTDPNLETNKYYALSATGGVGYKTMLDDRIEFQIQGGAGICKGRFLTGIFNSTDIQDPVFNAINVNTISLRGYLQPTVGFKNPRGGGIYIVPRLVYESFQDVSQESGIKVPNLRKQNFLLTEFYVLGRIDAKVLNVDIYGGFSSNLFNQVDNHTGNNDLYVVQPFLFGVGVSRTFAIH